MAERTVAAILREIAQVKAAGLEEPTRGILLASLRAEVTAIADAFARQGELPLQGGNGSAGQAGAAAKAAAEGPGKGRDK